MMNIKKPFQHSKTNVLKDKHNRISRKKNIRMDIQKCPVNTLLTSIFSGIAWNG